MNKKAQAQIITTVLIILLVLAAIVIVWQVVKGTVEKGAGEISTDCLTVDLEIKSITAETVAEEDGSVTIKRNTGVGDLQAITIVSDGVSLGEQSITNLASELGEDTISSLAITASKDVSVAAMVGDSKKLCEAADTETSGAAGITVNF